MRYLILFAAVTLLRAQEPPASAGDDVRGYNDTPLIIGQKWKVHDMDRPRPVKVTPGAPLNGGAPSDAIVLFDGKDLSQWVTQGRGGAGAIYGVWPPLVNPARPKGQWNVYDIAFEAPRFDGDKVIKPAYATVIFNGVLVQNHKAFLGATVWRKNGVYTAHPLEQPLSLQDHSQPVRFRNIWIRKVAESN